MLSLSETVSVSPILAGSAGTPMRQGCRHRSWQPGPEDHGPGMPRVEPRVARAGSTPVLLEAPARGMPACHHVSRSHHVSGRSSSAAVHGRRIASGLTEPDVPCARVLRAGTGLWHVRLGHHCLTARRTCPRDESCKKSWPIPKRPLPPASTRDARGGRGRRRYHPAQREDRCQRQHDGNLCRRSERRRPVCRGRPSAAEQLRGRAVRAEIRIARRLTRCRSAEHKDRASTARPCRATRLNSAEEILLADDDPDPVTPCRSIP